MDEEYRQKYGFVTKGAPPLKFKQGLTAETVLEISRIKNEPEWLQSFRLNAFDHFLKRAMPKWGPELGAINFEKFCYYIKPTEKQADSWQALPEEIKNTFEKLGIPEAERKFLAGVGAQFESENIYHNLQKQLAEKGVVFVDPDTGLNPGSDCSEMLKIASKKFREWFGRVVPYNDNKFAALNSAVFSGGSFIYVPPHVHVELPLQAYFRINNASMGQFERTLIIADEGSSVNYIEGCTAPIYNDEEHSLHSAVVEIVALPGSKIRYTTIQNWSNNVYNLVTKRAWAFDRATVEWIDANIGSRTTMKYPSVFLMGTGAKTDILTVAYAGKNQQQDTGGKVIHNAPSTSSKIVSKSISKDGGSASYRGLVKIAKGASGAKSSVRCDALLMDEQSKADTYPYNENKEETAELTHEAAVGRISDEKIFYLMSRGLTEDDAISMIINGFMECFTKELPMEYAIEFNRLIRMEMTGSVG